jgi:hypothetical protein
VPTLLPGALSDQPGLSEVLINDDSLDAANAWLSAAATSDSPRR